MDERRWINPHQPQTLYGATLLLYINAAFGLLFGFAFFLFPLGLAVVLGQAAAGYGIANEKRWAYVLGVVIAILRLLLLFAAYGTGVFGFPGILDLMFDGLLVGLLLHPMSRDYQRIWFR